MAKQAKQEPAPKPKQRNYAIVPVTFEDKAYIVSQAVDKPQYVFIHDCLELYKVRSIDIIPPPPPAPPEPVELTEAEKKALVIGNIKLVPVDYLKSVILEQNEICFTCTPELIALLMSKLSEVEKMELTPKDSTAQQKWSELINFALLFLLNNTNTAKEWASQQK